MSNPNKGESIKCAKEVREKSIPNLDKHTGELRVEQIKQELSEIKDKNKINEFEDKLVPQVPAEHTAVFPVSSRRRDAKAARKEKKKRQAYEKSFI